MFAEKTLENARAMIRWKPCCYNRNKKILVSSFRPCFFIEKCMFSWKYSRNRNRDSCGNSSLHHNFTLSLVTQRSSHHFACHATLTPTTLRDGPKQRLCWRCQFLIMYIYKSQIQSFEPYYMVYRLKQDVIVVWLWYHCQKCIVTLLIRAHFDSKNMMLILIPFLALCCDLVVVVRWSCELCWQVSSSRTGPTAPGPSGWGWSMVLTTSTHNKYSVTKTTSNHSLYDQ